MPKVNIQDLIKGILNSFNKKTWPFQQNKYSVKTLMCSLYIFITHNTKKEKKINYNRDTLTMM